MKDQLKITKYRNTLIVLCTFVLFVPFIFTTNLYPFFRFGMFAEKVQTSQGIELFEVRLGNSTQAVSQKQIAIPEHMLNYLIRNYYYKNQLDTCAKNLYALTNKKHTLHIYKKTIKGATSEEQLILQYPNE